MSGTPVPVQRYTITTASKNLRHQENFWYQGRKYSRTIHRQAIVVQNSVNNTCRVFRTLSRHVYVHQLSAGYTSAHFFRRTETLYIAPPF